MNKFDFRPLSFWSFNENMEDEEIRTQIHQFKEQGYGGFFIHARAGLTLEYMGEDWLHACRVAIEAARQEEMKAWLYDENGWPSGFAGGRVPALGEDYTAKHLYFIFRKPCADDGRVLAAYRKVTENEYVRVSNEEPANLYCCLGTLKGYADLLNPKAMDAFIAFTHEKYKEVFGEYFGNVIPGIFTDEPQLIGKFPYTFAYPEKFEETYGFDFFDCAWKLCFDGLEHAAFKYKAAKLVAKTLQKSFTEKINQWCERHHLIFTGHFSNEDGLCEQTNANYNLLAQYGQMERPGIDFLGRRLTSPVLVKQVSDGAYLAGKKMITSESFGCSGWDVTFNDLAWISDWQSAFGINAIVTHLSAYSMKGRRKRDYPAFFSYQEPWWNVFRTISEHIQKQNEFLSEGKREIQILVIYPITSMWCLLAGEHTHSDASRYISNQFRLLIENLLDLQKEFLLVTEDEFQHYAAWEDIECVIVPDSVSLDMDTYIRLQQLSEQDRKVVFINRRPTLCEGGPCDISKRITSEVVENRRGLLEKYFLATGQTNAVSVVEGFCNQSALGIILARRILNEKEHIFVINPSRQDTKQVFLKVKGKKEIVGAETFFDGEYTYTPFVLSPTQSRRFVVKEGTFGIEKKTCSPLTSRELSTFEVQLLEENALTIDKCDLYVNGALLCKDVLPAACADFLYKKAYESGKKSNVQIVYHFAMNITERMPERLFLTAESDGLKELLVNGHSVLDKKAGWWIDKAFHCFEIQEVVQNGSNEVRLGFTIVRPDSLEEQGDFEGYRNCFFYEIEPENVYIRGDFDVSADGKIREAIEDLRVDGSFAITDATKKEFGELTRQGLWFYRGNVSFKTKFEKRSNCTELCLKEMHGTAAQIFLNGQSAGMIYRAPYVLPISKYVKEGVNELEVILYGSNRNLLGPHHHVVGNPHFVGVPTFVEEKGFTDFMYPQITEEHTGVKRYSFVKLSCGTVILKEGGSLVET